MSILEAIKNRFGKRPRDANEEPQDQNATLRIKATKATYVPSPRRRSVRLSMQAARMHTANKGTQSPPGAFPGADEYAPNYTPAISENRKQANCKAKFAPVPIAAVTPANETPAPTLTEEETPVTALAEMMTPPPTPTKETPAPTLTGNKSTPKYTSNIYATQDASQGVSSPTNRRATKLSARGVQAQAPIQTTARQPPPQRRRSYLNDPRITPTNTRKGRVRKSTRNNAAREQLPSPSPSPTASLKEILADPSSLISKAHKALEEAYAKRADISKEVLRLQKSQKNNVFSRGSYRGLEDKLKSPTEGVARTPTSDDTAIKNVAKGGRINSSDDRTSLARPSGREQTESASPTPSNERSGDSPTTAYPSTRTSPSNNNDDSQTINASNIAAVMTKMSTQLAVQNEAVATKLFTHFAAQNEVFAKKMEQVSEILAQTNAKSLEAQQMITKLATQPPSTVVQPQVSIDTEVLKQAINRNVAERHETEFKELIGFWTSQKQQLANGHCSTPPQKDYFDPRSTLRKNRVVLPTDTSRAILEAHEVQYRYQLEECPFQKLLGRSRIQHPEASLYASLKNSVVGERKENYPSHPTLPYHSQSGELLTWRQCCGVGRIVEPSTFDHPEIPMQDGWADFQASVPARRRSGTMEYEETGAPAVIQTWKPNQGIVFSQSLPLPPKTEMPGLHFASPALSSSLPPISLTQQAALEAGVDEILRRGPRNASRHGASNISNAQPFHVPPYNAPPINRARQNAIDAGLDDILRRGPRNGNRQGDRRGSSINAPQSTRPYARHNDYVADLDRFLGANPRNSPRQPSVNGVGPRGPRTNNDFSRGSRHASVAPRGPRPNDADPGLADRLVSIQKWMDGDRRHRRY